MTYDSPEKVVLVQIKRPGKPLNRRIQNFILDVLVYERMHTSFVLFTNRCCRNLCAEGKLDMGHYSAG